MNHQVRTWLALRAGAVPAALQARMESALADVHDEPAVTGALANAAHACLRDALEAGEERGAALHLLAADALITYACEAAADADATALAGLAIENAPDRLAALFGTSDAAS